MPTKPLDRLTFVQGGLCFFCKEPLPKAEASVEHLVASANGGTNGDENCVACCKSVNALFGSMSLKEKFQVVLNQKGDFKCPNGNGTAHSPTPAVTKVPPKVTPVMKVKEDRLKLVMENLEQRDKAKPASVKTLGSTISALFLSDITEAEVSALIAKLESTGQIAIAATKVTYKF
jgi:hypothetical protein